MLITYTAYLHTVSFALLVTGSANETVYCYIYCELVPSLLGSLCGWHICDLDTWTRGTVLASPLHDNQHPNISFTLEKESGCKLHFLNIFLVTKKDDRFLTPCLPKTDPH